MLSAARGGLGESAPRSISGALSAPPHPPPAPFPGLPRRHNTLPSAAALASSPPAPGRPLRRARALPGDELRGAAIAGRGPVLGSVPGAGSSQVPLYPHPHLTPHTLRALKSLQRRAMQYLSPAIIKRRVGISQAQMQSARLGSRSGAGLPGLPRRWGANPRAPDGR